jgi:signal transduction histidine kinase
VEIYGRANGTETIIIDFSPIPVKDASGQVVFLVQEGYDITEPLADVLAHESSVTRVLSNLLTNAIKFVEPGTIPKIHIWSEKRPGEVRIWVEDDGVGIDPKYQHRLFRMFEMIPPDSHYDGSGVGLAVVRKAAERMNGTVGVEPDGKKGSKFWIQLCEA